MRSWSGISALACLAYSHLPIPGGRSEMDGWRIEADFAEMARDGRRMTWALRSLQQGIGCDAPSARELQTHRVYHRLTYPASSSRPPARFPRPPFLPPGCPPPPARRGSQMRVL